MLCLHLQLLVDELDREMDARVSWNDDARLGTTVI